VSFSRALSDEVRSQDTIIGLFVLLAIGLVLYLVLQQTYFQSQRTHWIQLNSVLSNSFGLSKGTVIELSGVVIGNVDSVLLRPDAKVEVTVLVNDEYAHLLSEDSRLKINSALALESVLSGVRLEFVPGVSEQMLTNGDSIEILEPKSLGQIVEEMKLEELAKQLQNIVANVDKLTSDLADQREDLVVTMENLRTFSGQTVKIGDQVSDFLLGLDKSNQALQAGLNQLNQTIKNLDEPASEALVSFNQSMTSAGEALISAKQVMASADEALVSLRPALDKMPELLATTNNALLSINQLSQTLSKHWLLSGDGGADESLTGASGSRLPSDKTLYRKKAN
jgi:ABC-type transporter Mla subunit MlaD